MKIEGKRSTVEDSDLWVSGDLRATGDPKTKEDAASDSFQWAGLMSDPSPCLPAFKQFD